MRAVPFSSRQCYGTSSNFVFSLLLSTPRPKPPASPRRPQDSSQGCSSASTPKPRREGSAFYDTVWDSVVVFARLSSLVSPSHALSLFPSTPDGQLAKPMASRTYVSASNSSSNGSTIPRRNLGSTATRTMGVKRFIAASPGSSPEIRLASSGRAITVTKEVGSQF
jgi:hypothetical protein